jgi:hypothetical protein
LCLLSIFSGKNGDRYEGEWWYNQKHGMGKVFYHQGAEEASYTGSWVEGKRSGLGILTLANGDRYEGHWTADQRDGPGRFFYKGANKVYEGEWLQGVPKCGQYQDAPPGSFPDDPDGSAGASAPSNFSIPQLRLLVPEAVMSEAITSLRQAAPSQVKVCVWGGVHSYIYSACLATPKLFLFCHPSETC